MSDPAPSSDSAAPNPVDRLATLEHATAEAADRATTESPLDGPAPTMPECLGRYRILRLLGRGGMGAVYLAEDSLLGRKVALKVPHGIAGDANALERFKREARSAGRLQHAHICPVFDVGEIDGVHLMTMAFIDGEPLTAQVADFARRPPREAAALVRTLALALQEAHEQGVIHRDLKPANVMLNRRGEPVVMDFGLAREIQTDATSQTLPGTVMGTPAYMPPEQARGDVTAIGPGCDIYSLGVILYELLTGRVPFEGNTMDVLVQHVRDEPPPPSSFRPDLEPHLEAICLKALAKKPSQRFLSMAEFALALDNWLTGGEAAGMPSVLAETDPLSAAAAETLVLLRTWGWEVGVEKIRAKAAGHGAGGPLAALLRWLEGGPAAAPGAEAPLRLDGLRQRPALEGWALLGQAFVNNRDHHFDPVEELLREAETRVGPGENVLRASIAHQRGFWLHHTGNLREAATSLHQALDLCGREHFLTGQVLDTLGLVHANKNNFHAAREFFEQAILCKQRFGDNAGVARSQRQLGQLYLDWDYPDRAEDILQEALEVALRAQDERGQANTFHYLGRALLAQGEREFATGRRAAARRSWAKAAEWLDASIRAHQTAKRDLLEGYARCWRALLCLAEDKLADADAHTRQAVTLFQQTGHAKGLAEAQAVRGALARRQQNYEESGRLLRQSLAHFDRTCEGARAARVQLEIARSLADAGALPQLVTGAFLDALRRAETCRRTEMVRAVEEELRGADEEAHWEHVFHRARGRAATADTTSLVDGESEVATTLFLNLRGFMQFCQGMEAGDVMRTLNQMLADLGLVLERHRAHVAANLGGGFLVLVRGAGHAERAVAAALDLIAVVEEFNRPRAVLGLRQLPVSIGIATGNLFLGNVGTYHKMDFTAIGAPVNLAARLVRQADVRWPCVSQETYESVRDRFEFAPGNPRVLELLGIGRHEVWDVIGRKKGSSTA